MQKEANGREIVFFEGSNLLKKVFTSCDITRDIIDPVSSSKAGLGRETPVLQ